MKAGIDFKGLNWMKKLSWLWTILFMIGGSIFTTVSVQYVLLDPSLFDNLSPKKWQLNIICVLIVYLMMLCITSKVNISVMISHVFFMMLAFINYFVYLFTHIAEKRADALSMGS